jgi:hypothetical protein
LLCYFTIWTQQLKNLIFSSKTSWGYLCILGLWLLLKKPDYYIDAHVILWFLSERKKQNRDFTQWNENAYFTKCSWGGVLYVIKFVNDLRQVGGFLRVLQVSSTNKTDCHDITEILLKVALSTQTKPECCYIEKGY